MNSLRYRSDIDGLRAVAVLGVVIYHAFPWVVPGGFTGVDIFFVISGYLISGILYKGHLEGNFSYKEFYARRIRRLFPSLIIVLLLCLGYGWLVLLPQEYQQLGKHVAAGTLFIQNMVFWKESGYWDISASLKPLLHLWSLGVEEQFYLFFPPLLVILWKRPRVLIPAMILLLVGTFIANMVMSYQAVVSDFFLTPYRAWEFLGGSLLAWWHYDRGHEEEVPAYREALSWSGLLLLALGMTLLGKNQPYPGWRALLPVAGTVMLMEGGRGAWVNRKILSHPALVWVGLISYPLYLFHWPTLSFVHIIKGEKPADVYVGGALAVAFLLTVVTYYLVEKPIRFSKSKTTLPMLLGAFVATAAIGLLVQVKIIRPHCDSHPDKIRKIENAIQDNYKNIFLGYERIRPKGSLILIHTTGGKNLKTIFFGDSHMEQHAPRIQELLKNNKNNDAGAIFVSSGGVPPIPGATSKSRKDCKEMTPLFLKVINEEKNIRNVTIAGLWPDYFTKDHGHTVDGISLNTEEGKAIALEHIGELIKELKTKGKKVTILLACPSERRLDPKNMYCRNFFGFSFIPPPKILLSEYQRSVEEINFKIRKIAEENGATVIDPVPFLSKDGFLTTESDGNLIYFDNAHIRPSYMRSKIHYIDDVIAP